MCTCLRARGFFPKSANRARSRAAAGPRAVGVVLRSVAAAGAAGDRCGRNARSDGGVRRLRNRRLFRRARVHHRNLQCVVLVRRSECGGATCLDPDRLRRACASFRTISRAAKRGSTKPDGATRGRRGFICAARHRWPRSWLARLPPLFGFVVPALVLIELLVESGGPTRDFDRHLVNSLTLAGIAAIVVTGGALLLAYARKERPKALAGKAASFASLGYAVPGSVVAVGVLTPFAAFDNTILSALSERLFGVAHRAGADGRHRGADLRLSRALSRGGAAKCRRRTRTGDAIDQRGGTAARARAVRCAQTRASAADHAERADGGPSRVRRRDEGTCPRR